MEANGAHARFKLIIFVFYTLTSISWLLNNSSFFNDLLDVLFKAHCHVIEFGV